MAFCGGKCESSYSRKENWEKHVNIKQIRRSLKDGGGMVDNPCYQLPSNHPRIFDASLDKAKQLTLDKLC